MIQSTIQRAEAIRNGEHTKPYWQHPDRSIRPELMRCGKIRHKGIIYSKNHRAFKWLLRMLNKPLPRPKRVKHIKPKPIKPVRMNVARRPQPVVPLRTRQVDTNGLHFTDPVLRVTYYFTSPERMNRYISRMHR